MYSRPLVWSKQVTHILLVIIICKCMVIWFHAASSMCKSTLTIVSDHKDLFLRRFMMHTLKTFLTRIKEHPAPSSQRRPQRKRRRCEILDTPHHNLPSLNLAPLRTTHIQQELWTYKKDKAFSMTPTEAINTLYYDDMDILHIDDWRFFTPRKETEMIHPKDRNNTTHICPYKYWKMGPTPLLISWTSAKIQ